LVDKFGFSVGLRVVGGGKGEVIVENSSKFSSECRGELWAMVRDNLVVESIAEEDFVEEEGGNSLGGDSFLSGAENYPLSKAMVYHNQERIEAGGGGEVGDKIARDLLERPRGRGLNWSERWDSGVRVGFVLLADAAAFNILADVRSEARPSKLSGN